MKKIMWAKMTMEEIRALDKDKTVVIFPIGSTEGHGPQCPVECDAYDATELAKKIALACQDQGITIVVTPTLSFGFSEWMDYPGKISLTSKTLQSTVWDVCKSIAIDNGFKRLIILNGHGGNPHILATAIQDFYQEYKILVLVIDWFQLVGDSIEGIVESLWHADDGETSVALALGMDVDMSKAVKEVPKKPFKNLETKIAGVSSRKFFSPWTTVSERSKSGVQGDATKATKEKGEKIVTIVVERSIKIIKELLKYPYQSR